jgi:hypothetical protein
MNYHRLAHLAKIAILTLISVACGSGQDSIQNSVRITKVTKEAYAEVTDKIRFNDTFNEKASHNNEIPQQSSVQFEYILPNNWAEAAKAQFRDLNFSFPAEPNASCYLTVLPIKGGEVLPNLNRWRGQFGLPALTAASDQESEQTMCLSSNTALFKLQGNFNPLGEKGKDFIAFCLIQLDDTNAYTIKFTGPSNFVLKEKSNFIALLQSLKTNKPNVNETPVKEPTIQELPQITDLLKWEVPTGWVLGEAKSQRVATFKPTNKETPECYISVLRGDLLENLNRWRTQMGLQPVQDISKQELEKFSTSVGAGIYVVLEGNFKGGMSGQQIDNAMMLGAIIPGSSKNIFIKMVGKKEEVLLEKESFVKLIKSLNRDEIGK